MNNKTVVLVMGLLAASFVGYWLLRPEAPSPSTAVATDWSTYDNATYAFAVSYPPNFAVSEREIANDTYLEVAITDDMQRPYLFVRIYGNADDTTESWFKGPYPRTVSPSGNTTGHTLVQRSVGNLKGIEHYGAGPEGHGYVNEFLFRQGSVLYVFSLNPLAEGRVDEDSETPMVDPAIYNRILSSIKIGR